MKTQLWQNFFLNKNIVCHSLQELFYIFIPFDIDSMLVFFCFFIFYFGGGGRVVVVLSSNHLIHYSTVTNVFVVC